MGVIGRQDVRAGGNWCWAVISKTVATQSNGWRAEQYVRVVEPHLTMKYWMKLTDISDYDKQALYDTWYPVIYLNKYTMTHSESFY